MLSAYSQHIVRIAVVNPLPLDYDSLRAENDIGGKDHKMTTARERTNAVVGTRELLRTLATSGHATPLGDVQRIAEYLLRDYALDGDLAVSAAALPDLWEDRNRSKRHGNMSSKFFFLPKREPQ
ncbi:hypothetical protein PMI06_003086 [Burkholderia sp. BT03]|nr:hypothetical protein PMI06_003086 [Burkholderia sp. BT03]SKC62298.1 hypothetical protein SAMN06266956_1254 [Paraburkholderia hospita]